MKNYNLTVKAAIKISLVLVVFLLGCNNDDIKLNDTRTEIYLRKYMDYPPHVYPSWNSTDFSYTNCSSDNIKNDSISILYSNDKIVKRIGYFLSGNASMGFPSLYTRDIYDTLIYTNNQLTILTKSKSQSISGVSAYKKVIYYENERISKTVQSFQYTDEQDMTVYYTYTNGLLTKKIGHKGSDLSFQSDFFYNKNGNLDSIVSRQSKYDTSRDNFEIDFSSKNRIKEVFENFDKSENKLKPFIIFDETFNRSLSANNYGKYNYYDFDMNGIIKNEWHYTYNLKYENGTVNFAR